MKKAMVILPLIILIISSANGQFTKIGGGLTYGTGYHFNNERGLVADLNRSPRAGIIVKGIYELKLPVYLSPSFTYFIPRTNLTGTPAGNGEETRSSSIMFDLNGHYVFNSDDRFEFYALGGLNITFAKIKRIGISYSGTDNVPGLNIGAGTSIKLTETMVIFGEIKFIVSKYDQVLVNAGTLVNIHWSEKTLNSGK
jgi:opacity protein-like surface antigen